MDEKVVKDITSIYVSGADLPGIVKTKESDMLYQMSVNQNSMSLAYPHITSKEIKREILIAHENGDRCFINIELEPSSGKSEIEGFPYKVLKASVETDAVKFAKLAGSQKLEMYVKSYDKSSQIGVVIWTREPYACYTILIMQPWIVARK